MNEGPFIAIAATNLTCADFAAGDTGAECFRLRLSFPVLKLRH